MTAFRIQHGPARVNFKKPLRFTYNGQGYDGFDGDTLGVGFARP